MKKWCILNKAALVFCFYVNCSPQLAYCQIWDTLPIQLNVYGVLRVEALYVYKDTLFIGGAFIDADTIVLNSMAAWDGYKWIQFGTGIYQSTTADDFQSYKNELYMVGSFLGDKPWLNDAVNGVPETEFAARWDGAQWKSAGIINAPPINEIRNAEVFNDTLYAGGVFSPLSGNSNIDCCLAKWDGNNWYEVVEGGQVYAMTVFDNALYVGGDVYMVDSVPVSLLAKYDGVSWSDAGKGKIGGNPATALGTDTLNGFLYVATTGLGISRWDGYEWKVISSPWVNDSFYVPQGGDMIYYHGELYSGGGYSVNGTDTIFGLARWNGEKWDTCRSGTKPDWGVETFAVYHDTLFVGGAFRKAGGIPAHYLAKWYTPPDTTLCSYLQALIVGSPDTVYLDSGGVSQFHANIPKASSWSWNFGSGQTGTGQNPVKAFTGAGSFNVQVVIAYKGCLDTAYHQVVVLPYTGIEEKAADIGQLKIYPNPTGGSFIVEIPSPKFQAPNSKLEIYDVKGKLVKQIAIGNRQLTIETNGWERGVYFVKLLVDEKESAVEKIIVE